MQCIVLTRLNKVEELEYALELEDAAWLANDGKWVVLYDRETLQVDDLSLLLQGDGKTPETCFQVKMRIGGAGACRLAATCMHASECT